MLGEPTRRRRGHLEELQRRQAGPSIGVVLPPLIAGGSTGFFARRADDVTAEQRRAHAFSASEITLAAFGEVATDAVERREQPALLVHEPREPIARDLRALVGFGGARRAWCAHRTAGSGT